MSYLAYLYEAYQEAVKYNTDPSTQNGAVLVTKDGEIVARGANHFPREVVESPERWERPAKYQYVEHAERNVIFDASRKGISTVGLTMYCPWFACTDCARAIIQCGIREVIGHDTALHLEGSKSWKDSIEVAYKMFDEAGVKYKHVPGKIGLSIRFNGKMVDLSGL